jgi:hypothetical protein
MSEKNTLARRPVLAAMAAVLGVAAAGGAAYELGVFGGGYPSGSFDEVLAAMRGRAGAVEIGKALKAEGFDARATEAALREKLKGASFEDVIAGDIAGGRLVEVKGWVLPKAFAQMCAVAAG